MPVAMPVTTSASAPQKTAPLASSVSVRSPVMAWAACFLRTSAQTATFAPSACRTRSSSPAQASIQPSSATWA